MNNSFEDIYTKQIEFQKSIKNLYDFDVKEIPEDNIQGFSYHIQHLISEIGELLCADKRWKNLRNKKYDKTNKLEELADCFIVLINISIFSGFSANEIFDAIKEKIEKNSRRES